MVRRLPTLDIPTATHQQHTVPTVLPRLMATQAIQAIQAIRHQQVACRRPVVHRPQAVRRPLSPAVAATGRHPLCRRMAAGTMVALTD